MKTLSIIAIVLFVSSAVSAQKNYIELRGASPYYQYEEYARDLPHDFNVDMVHIGVTGQHQLFVGLGRHFNPAKGVSITPYFYGVVGTNDQRGIMLAVNTSVERGKWKASAFLGRFHRIKGNVPHYAVLDTGDITRVLNKRIDIGLSTGFFRQEGQWNLQSGPMVRLKDSRGSWAVSYRFGNTNELRLTRTFSF